jgi:Icc-related predicted phosphoesterase
VIRIATVGDIHVGLEPPDRLAEGFAQLAGQADVLLLAGDLTKCGHPDEARRVADVLAGVDVPIVAVLGNHDYQNDTPGEVTAVLRDAGVTVLEGDSVVIDLPGGRLGVAGVKGFGGGFGAAHATCYGEPEMKAFVAHTHAISARLAEALERVHTEHCAVVVALLHYSPVADTLAGERCEIFPFLGSELLAEAVDRCGADLVLHGHAHAGTHEGATAGGVPVRNVAMPVLGCSHRVFEIGAVARVEVPSGRVHTHRSRS